MFTTLLRPYLLGCKNGFLRPGGKSLIMSREIAILLLAILLMCGVYFSVHSMLEGVAANPVLRAAVPPRLISVSLFVFFLLLLFSNGIAALGCLYGARDLPLIMSLPVSKTSLFTSRLVLMTVQSSWMFLLFEVPAILAFASSLDTKAGFIAAAAILTLPYILIPAALSVAVVTLFVTVFPAARAREILLVSGLAAVCVVLAFRQEVGSRVAFRSSSPPELSTQLLLLNDPHPSWMPSKWFSDVLCSLLSNPSIPASQSELAATAVLLISTALGLSALAYLLFEFFFSRGWDLSMQSGSSLRIPHSKFWTSVGRFLLPFDSQLRALLFKELRMFLRDTTQALQLMLFLLMAAIYLYNFRALREVASIHGRGEPWWLAVLSVSNIAFGACVLSAIATRFIFPSISLEGYAYVVVRSAPLTIRQLLRRKMLVWLVPTAALSLTLLVSGTFAIQAPFATILATAAIGLMLSIGIVGLGIGVGAVFAKFDWDYPSQVLSSFGSLVFMLLSLVLAFLTLIPASLLLVVTNVPDLASQMGTQEYATTVALSLFLVFLINFIAARHALATGVEHLTELEK